MLVVSPVFLFNLPSEIFDDLQDYLILLIYLFRACSGRGEVRVDVGVKTSILINLLVHPMDFPFRVRDLRPVLLQ